MLLILLRRLRDLIVIMFIVGTALFFIIRLIPGDPAVAILGETATPDQLDRLRADLGLSGPLYHQYFSWLLRILHGDFGNSISQSAPVLNVLFGHILPTLTLAVFTVLISFGLAVLISVWSAASPRNPIANGLVRLSSLGLAVPGFWIALLMIWLFALQFRLFPTSGYANILTDPVQAVPRLVLPVASLVIGSTASMTLILRESVLSELSHLYLRTARSKGLSEFRVVLKHVMPNALLPVITVVGLDFAILIGGVVVTESVFVIPGLGSLLLGAISSRDYPLIQGGAMLIAFLFVVVNLLVDLTYAVVDPKVRAA